MPNEKDFSRLLILKKSFYKKFNEKVSYASAWVIGTKMLEAASCE